MSPLVRDILILAGGAILPAGIALALLRGQLRRAGGFWMGMMFGLTGLAVLGIAAVWGAVVMAERDIAACRAGQGMDCEDANLLVVGVGMPAVAAILLFVLGAGVVRLARRADG